MLHIKNLHKHFGKAMALEDISLHIPAGCVYGLVGSNGSGKSTLLRLIAGVMRPDRGVITFCGDPLYENAAAKQQIRFIPDEHYFPQGATMKTMASLYGALYPNFDKKRLSELQTHFRLTDNEPILSLSRGKRRLAAACLALSSKPQLLLMDETVDGLDPVMRHAVKSVIARDVTERGSSAVLVSHSLRELEGVCDQLALLYDGRIILDQDVFGLRQHSYKVQIAYDHPFTRERFQGISILHYEQQASVATMILEGERDTLEAMLRATDPLLLEMLPLTLEEVFLQKLRLLNYDYTALLGGDDL